jgi:hypothetical protein
MQQHRNDALARPGTTVIRLLALATCLHLTAMSETNSCIGDHTFTDTA